LLERQSGPDQRLGHLLRMLVLAPHEIEAKTSLMEAQPQEALALL
jgi:hypothetical protein